MRHYRPFTLAIMLPVALAIAGCAKQRVSQRAPGVPSAVAIDASQQINNAAYAGEGDYEARVLRAQLDADPSSVDVRLSLARHYRKQGFPEVAIEHCRIACERAPDSVEAHVTLAKMLRDDRRPAEGAQVLSDFAVRKDGDVEVWAWLGVLRDEAGDWKAGETAHRRAIALAPKRDDLMNNLGYCLLEQDRKAEAAEAFRAALKLNPQSAIARNNLGLALTDKPAEALLDWQSISGPAGAHNNLAAALMEAGKYADARREIQTALDYDAHYAPALNNLHLISERDGKPAQIALRPRLTTKWSRRMATRWQRLWARQASRQETNDSGSPLASR